MVLRLIQSEEQLAGEVRAEAKEEGLTLNVQTGQGVRRFPTKRDPTESVPGRKVMGCGFRRLTPRTCVEGVTSPVRPLLSTTLPSVGALREILKWSHCTENELSPFLSHSLDVHIRLRTQYLKREMPAEN
ncbi:hypothetical protein chiPu_0026864 [Chiloscyllium punctatum]|uniref:Uncharacterized protein n=1 Tax=Chiloscyllium punctatum TaxID=137246 RepID=A0A401TIQ0_CHIPU|nr:hypothetical protein [Chiloscyllium punctatum]